MLKLHWRHLIFFCLTIICFTGSIKSEPLINTLLGGLVGGVGNTVTQTVDGIGGLLNTVTHNLDNLSLNLLNLKQTSSGTAGSDLTGTLKYVSNTLHPRTVNNNPVFITETLPQPIIVPRQSPISYQSTAPPPTPPPPPPRKTQLPPLDEVFKKISDTLAKITNDLGPSTRIVQTANNYVSRATQRLREIILKQNEPESIEINYKDIGTAITQVTFAVKKLIESVNRVTVVVSDDLFDDVKESDVEAVSALSVVLASSLEIVLQVVVRTAEDCHIFETNELNDLLNESTSGISEAVKNVSGIVGGITKSLESKKGASKGLKENISVIGENLTNISKEFDTNLSNVMGILNLLNELPSKPKPSPRPVVKSPEIITPPLNLSPPKSTPPPPPPPQQQQMSPMEYSTINGRFNVLFNTIFMSIESSLENVSRSFYVGPIIKNVNQISSSILATVNFITSIPTFINVNSNVLQNIVNNLNGEILSNLPKIVTNLQNSINNVYNYLPPLLQNVIQTIWHSLNFVVTIISGLVNEFVKIIINNQVNILSIGSEILRPVIGQIITQTTSTIAKLL